MPGYIEVQDSPFDSKFESTGNVLSCVDSFDVILSTKAISSDLKQTWQCGKPNKSGWFTIMQPGTGGFLVNHSSEELKVKGTYRIVMNSRLGYYSILKPQISLS